MENIIAEIESVFKIISSVPVSGDSVDAIAAARVKLRRVYSDLKELNPTENNEVQADGSNQ